ncbi:hypothetical protein D3C81_2194830 [compost metagenome]
MQRAFKRANRRSYTGIDVGKRSHGYPSGKSRRVQLMVSMQNQRSVQSFDGHDIRLLSPQHIQEILGDG